MTGPDSPPTETAAEQQIAPEPAAVDPAAPDHSGPAEPSRKAGVAANLAPLILLGLLAVLVAVVGVFYLPWWIGPVPVPWSVVPVAVFAWWAPRQGHRLTGSVIGAAVPILVWFVITAWLALSRNALYAGQPIAVQNWRMYLLVGVGVLIAAWGIGGIWGRATLERAKAERQVPAPPAE